MSEKSGTEVRLDHLEAGHEAIKTEVADLRRDFSLMHRAIAWALGAVAGVSALAGAMVSGVLKRLAS